jgi:hypothetical protein
MRAIFGAMRKAMHVSMALSYLGGTAAAGFIMGTRSTATAKVVRTPEKDWLVRGGKKVECVSDTLNLELGYEGDHQAVQFGAF